MGLRNGFCGASCGRDEVGCFASEAVDAAGVFEVGLEWSVAGEVHEEIGVELEAEIRSLALRSRGFRGVCGSFVCAGVDCGCGRCAGRCELISS